MLYLCLVVNTMKTSRKVYVKKLEKRLIHEVNADGSKGKQINKMHYGVYDYETNELLYTLSSAGTIDYLKRTQNLQVVKK